MAVADAAARGGEVQEPSPVCSLWFRECEDECELAVNTRPGASRRRFVGSLHVTCGSSVDRVDRESVKSPILQIFRELYAANFGINLGPFALWAGEKMRSRNLSGLAHGVHAPLDRDDPPALQPPKRLSSPLNGACIRPLSNWPTHFRHSSVLHPLHVKPTLTEIANEVCTPRPARKYMRARLAHCTLLPRLL